jgi:adenylyltransferase/sulfurtransferase
VASPYDVAQIRPSEVKAKMDRGDEFLLIDVREPWEAEVASIPGGVLIPTYELANRTSEIPKNKETILYCHTGSRSMMAAFFLRRLGYTHIKNLSGGIDGWSVEVDPSVPRYE